LLKNDFARGHIDTTLFRKIHDKDLLIVQVYVDDIIFGSTNKKMCEDFSNLVQSEFEMSMMENFASFWVCKSNNKKRTFLFFKKNTLEIFSKNTK